MSRTTLKHSTPGDCGSCGQRVRQENRKVVASSPLVTSVSRVGLAHDLLKWFQYASDQAADD